MNLNDQLGALESSLDALLEPSAAPAQPSDQSAQSSADSASNSAAPEAPAAPPAPDEPVTLTVSRPHQDAIQMTIGGKSVLLNPEGISELIDELSTVRASMTVEQPTGIAPGWRFASTKDPIMATKKQSNGDRLLILRHGGHGWVPFTFSPNMVVELYAMLTKK
jgi:hypothetical protein